MWTAQLANHKQANEYVSVLMSITLIFGYLSELIIRVPVLLIDSHERQMHKE